MNIQELRDKFPIFHRAYFIAEEAHANQKRRDGKPYMTHIDAVIEKTYQLSLKLQIVPKHYSVIYTDMLLSLAALHDTFEDNEKFDVNVVIDELSHFLTAYPDHRDYFRILFADAVLAISKKIKGVKNYSDYSEYVFRVKQSNFSRVVKIADLMHNISDLESGNLKEKYQLTLAILNQK